MTRQELEYRIKTITYKIGKLNHRLYDCYNDKNNHKFNWGKGTTHLYTPCLNEKVSRIKQKQTQLNNNRQGLLIKLKELNNSSTSYQILKKYSHKKHSKQNTQDEEICL